ncbi:hypothetical protein SKAU_G00343760 [Synaphobranchus kaupii]|uniref:Uncharacterized protein n=1 Tax=Synaphobranchus kaupii TaxID=118154 RepID=A0A9Q1EJ38_SYNKA|nr:hypothetical protein SKAU_G00343760 [Synaphobranchus kaupii]
MDKVTMTSPIAFPRPRKNRIESRKSFSPPVCTNCVCSNIFKKSAQAEALDEGKAPIAITFFCGKNLLTDYFDHIAAIDLYGERPILEPIAVALVSNGTIAAPRPTRK